MRDQLKIAFIFVAGIFLSAAPYLPANPTNNMLAAVARKKAGGGGGPTLLLNETFEGPGVVETWATGTWASDQYATSPAPLAGSYSGRKTTTTAVIHTLGASYTTLYGKFIVNAAVINNSNDLDQFVVFYNASDTIIGQIRHQAGTTKNFMRWRAYQTGGTQQTAASNSGLEATNYWFWWEWISSTGAGDGILRVWYHTSDNFASKTLIGSGTTDGTQTDGVRKIGFRIMGGGTPGDWIFDNIQVAETQIQ